MLASSASSSTPRKPQPLLDAPVTPRVTAAAPSPPSNPKPAAGLQPSGTDALSSQPEANKSETSSAGLESSGTNPSQPEAQEPKTDSPERAESGNRVGPQSQAVQPQFDRRSGKAWRPGTALDSGPVQYADFYYQKDTAVVACWVSADDKSKVFEWVIPSLNPNDALAQGMLKMASDSQAKRPTAKDAVVDVAKLYLKFPDYQADHEPNGSKILVQMVPQKDRAALVRISEKVGTAKKRNLHCGHYPLWHGTGLGHV